MAHILLVLYLELIICISFFGLQMSASLILSFHDDGHFLYDCGLK